jgi:rhodanese-related sulfurtransferase
MFKSILTVAIIAFSGYLIITLFMPKKRDIITPQYIQNAMIIDVRTADEFADSHFKGAINIPLAEVPSRIDAFKTDKPLIIYCRSGNRSGQAIKQLKDHGIRALNGINQAHLESIH